MAELVPILTGAGGFGAFTILIAYLLNSNRADRKDQREAIAEARRRADAEAERHEATRALLEEARQARHSAEDRTAELSREIQALRAQVAALQARIDQMESGPGGG